MNCPGNVLEKSLKMCSKFRLNTDVDTELLYLFTKFQTDPTSEIFFTDAKS